MSSKFQLFRLPLSLLLVSFAESSSREDSVECDADVSSEEEKKVTEVDSSTTNCTDGNILIALS